MARRLELGGLRLDGTRAIERTVAAFLASMVRLDVLTQPREARGVGAHPVFRRTRAAVPSDAERAGHVGQLLA